ncbi:MAG: DUF4234 domain-containing protein [Bacilli bacterium]|nr:DUF4234 domain-containing protein [Bacilli bacterium]
MNITKRDIAICIILTVVTCGIYGIVWFIQLTDDVKNASDDTEFTSGGIAFLLSLVTCGIYGIYWAYKMGEMMKKAEEKNNLEVKDNAIVYLLLSIFGFSIIVYALIQSDLNKIATEKKAA